MTKLEVAVKELEYRGRVPVSNHNKGKWELLSLNYLFNGDQICVVEDTSHNATVVSWQSTLPSEEQSYFIEASIPRRPCHR